MRGPFRRGDHAELADRLLDELAVRRDHVVAAEGEIWTHEGGIWRARRRDELRRIVKGFAGTELLRDGDPRALRISAGATDGAITLACAEAAHSDFFAEATPGVAFANGFVVVEGGRVVLHKHAPEHRARHGHSFAFEEAARADELLEFLEEVFADANEDDRAARIACLQEHSGACLVGLAPRYQRCVVLHGPGGNSKSTTEQVVYRGALPEGTCASLAPQYWPERFQLARLLGVLGNVVDELPEAELMRTGVFKSVVGGEPQHIDRKHRDPFEARITCGHVFAANALPPTRDLSEGFFRRFIIIRFDRRFDDRSDCDRRRAERVVAACRPGIVRWALEGAARLLARGEYTVPASSVEAVVEWRRSSDSVALYIAEQTRRAAPDELGTAAAHLYARYRAWCSLNGCSAVSARTLAHRMEAAGLVQIRRSDARRYPVVLLAEDA